MNNPLPQAGPADRPPGTLAYASPRQALEGGPASGDAVRKVAILLCIPLMGWGALRPLIVAHLDPMLRVVGLLLLGLPVLIACFVVWATGACMLLATARHATRRDWMLVAIPIALGITTLAWMRLAPGSLRVRGPKEIAAASWEDNQQAWNAAAAEATAIGRDRRATWQRTIGGQFVDDVAQDANGGLWFRTATRPDMIDRWSFGLHYRPLGYTMPRLHWDATQPTTPFGSAYLNLKPLGNGWYSFEVNDDW